MNNDNAKSIRVPSNLFKTLIGVSIVLIVALVFITYKYTTTSFDQDKLVRLEAENTQKDQKITLLSENLKTLDTRMQKIESFQRRLHIKTPRTTPNLWPTSGYLDNPKAEHKQHGTKHPKGTAPWASPTFGGLDIFSQMGSNVVATADGSVLDVREDPVKGNLVTIDHYSGYCTRYGHLDSFKVKKGDPVTRGQLIGYVGKTGQCSTPKLYYEIRYNNKIMNPIDFIINPQKNKTLEKKPLPNTKL